MACLCHLINLGPEEPENSDLSTIFTYPSSNIRVLGIIFKSSINVILFNFLKKEQLEKMKKMNLLLRKCKTLSRQLGRSSSYSSLRSKSTREDLIWNVESEDNKEDFETILVGSSRRRYVIKSKYLSHPLLNALIEKSKQKHAWEGHLSVKCEVVLFDHLLWLLENADPRNLTSDSLEELADLYVV